jgi:hypothetical protein
MTINELKQEALVLIGSISAPRRHDTQTIDNARPCT